jgi:hypothetical protein
VNALTDALAHPADLVRAHAVWAVRRLGLDSLLAAVSDDASPEVRVELDADVVARVGAA